MSPPKKLSCSVIAGGFSSLPHVEEEDEFLAEGFVLFRFGHPVARPAFVKKKKKKCFMERIFRSGHNFPVSLRAVAYITAAAPFMSKKLIQTQCYHTIVPVLWSSLHSVAGGRRFTPLSTTFRQLFEPFCTNTLSVHEAVWTTFQLILAG